ncbi:MAG: DNA polymerase III subunit epsilon [Spiribacter sp.]|nr:DNA polymerase III subunit epsilon [Spiribacter sp.]MDR9454813.1 DNA polymerase III subunit epsilon [Spiribacter sp.]
MRQIILDTETTGLEPADGHRVIEIGCYELEQRRPTGRTFHEYLNPGRPVDPEAAAVHGISDAFLSNKPRFADVAQDFIAFVGGAEVVIHNAPFDVGFLDHELARLGEAWGCLTDHCQILDSLELARRRHPGQRNSLDALCRRYSVDNSSRALHGALLDAEILADVYLAMTGGQVGLGLGAEETTGAALTAEAIRPVTTQRPALPVIEPNEAEREAHEAWLERLDQAAGGACVWRTLPAEERA